MFCKWSQVSETSLRTTKTKTVYESEVARQSWLSSDFWTNIKTKIILRNDSYKPKFRSSLVLNLYFPKRLSLYTIPFSFVVSPSLFSTCGMTNCIGTEGKEFTQTNRSRHKVCRHINALKGNLTSSMLRDNSSEQNRRSFLPLNVFISGIFPKLEHVLWLLLLTYDTVATGGRVVRSSGMTEKYM